MPQVPRLDGKQLRSCFRHVQIGAENHHLAQYLQIVTAPTAARHCRASDARLLPCHDRIANSPPPAHAPAGRCSRPGEQPMRNFICGFTVSLRQTSIHPSRPHTHSLARVRGSLQAVDMWTIRMDVPYVEAFTLIEGFK